MSGNRLYTRGGLRRSSGLRLDRLAWGRVARSAEIFRSSEGPKPLWSSSFGGSSLWMETQLGLSAFISFLMYLYQFSQERQTEALLLWSCSKGSALYGHFTQSTQRSCSHLRCSVLTLPDEHAGESFFIHEINASARCTRAVCVAIWGDQGALISLKTGQINDQYRS